MSGSVARDLTGTRINMLTVIRRAENTSTGRARWLCRCDCGTETVVHRSGLYPNGIKSCGCIKRRRGSNSPIFDDKTGRRYGKLTVLGLARIRYEDCTRKDGGDHQTRTYWFCKCDCGNSVEVVTSSLIRGQSCGCVKIERIAKLNRKYKDRDEAAFMYFLQAYKGGAQRRGIEWNLTEEEFGGLVFLNCSICGAEPETKSFGKKKEGRLTLLANGIDRIDNTRGYCPDNVAPACKACNLAKGTRSLDEFLVWIARAAAYQAKISALGVIYE